MHSQPIVAAPSARSLPQRGARLLLAAALAAGLVACAAVAPAPQVQRLTQQQFSPTQTVDVLDVSPQEPFTGIAKLNVSDPTGTATRDQLVAQLVETARSLGADAIVVERVERSDSSRVAFDPSGGQMQGGQQVKPA